MLLAALNLPFSFDFQDTRRCVARIESELVSKEFDALALPAQPSLSPISPFHQNIRVRALIDWMCEISVRKHALIVCSTNEWPRTPDLYRTTLVVYNGRLVARHILWPQTADLRKTWSLGGYATLIRMPAYATAIMLDEDTKRPISLTALCQSDISMCFVSSVLAGEELVLTARNVAARFGVLVALAGYTSATANESEIGGTVIISPTGADIAPISSSCGLRLAEIADVPAWVTTCERDNHMESVEAVIYPENRQRPVRYHYLGEDNGFYCP